MARAITQKIKSYSVVTPEEASRKPSVFVDDPDRHLKLGTVPKPVAASLRWAKRPDLVEGNDSRTYVVRGPEHRFAIDVGHVQNGHAEPFEVWVKGDTAPRGLAPLAKSLSMDMRSRDRGFLKAKLESLAKTPGKPFELTLPDHRVVEAPSEVAAFAMLVDYRCHELKAYDLEGPTPVLDALMSRKEPKTTASGSNCWFVDFANPNSGDNISMFVKELALPDGTVRPYSVWLGGNYPKSLDGLCKSLSFDLRVIEVEWALLKLRQLISVAEVNGEFRAQVPGKEKTAFYPSTVAYMASLIIDRLAYRGLCEADGSPKGSSGVVAFDKTKARIAAAADTSPKGMPCSACGNPSSVKMDGGCATCQECGHSHCS